MHAEQCREEAAWGLAHMYCPNTLKCFASFRGKMPSRAKTPGTTRSEERGALKQGR